MIKHWLHEPPQEDMEQYILQAAQAAWIEERYWEQNIKANGGV